MPSPRETNPVAERVLNDRNLVQRSVHPIQKDDAIMRPWIARIVPNSKFRAAATGISAGLLLLGSFTVAVDLGLLPVSSPEHLALVFGVVDVEFGLGWDIDET